MPILIIVLGLVVLMGEADSRMKGSRETEREATGQDRSTKSAGHACAGADTSSTLKALLDAALTKWSKGGADDRREALACMNAATHHFPEAADAWRVKGALLQQVGNAEAAASAYLTATSLNPSDPEYHHQLGGLLLGQGAHRAEEALLHLRKARALSPLSAAIAADFALGLYYTGHAEAAVTMWRECAQLDAGNALQYYYNVVGVYQERSEWAPAQALLEEMLSIDPRSSETLESLGVVQSTRALYSQAVTSLRHSLALVQTRKQWSDLDRLRLLAAIGDAHMNSENFAEAIPPYTGAQFTCCTGTNVQILTHQAPYTEALDLSARLEQQALAPPPLSKQVLSLLALLVQTYTYDAAALASLTYADVC
jgi:tetratricopeptide (TPR) repeat protein